MRRFGNALTFLFAVILTAAPNLVVAGDGSEAASKVRIFVETIVSVESGAVQSVTTNGLGEVNVDVEFHVSANTDVLLFQCSASDLFKAGDPQSLYFMIHEGGVLLTIPAARPLSGGSSFLAFDGGPTEMIDGFTLYPTEARPWTSSSLGTFTRDVVATFTWKQMGLLLPPGAYAGVVKMVAAERSF